jgi:hypothetical protein
MERWAGGWKRVCATRSFESFQRGRDVSTLVAVEPVATLLGGAGAGAAAAPAAGASGATAAAPLVLRWSFGTAPDSMRVGFTVALASGSGAGSGAGPAQGGGGGAWRALAVTLPGGEATGFIREDGSALSLTLMPPGGTLASVN